ncbi:unnamed protein product, partial [Symbiodinium necroappetens]
VLGGASAGGSHHRCGAGGHPREACRATLVLILPDPEACGHQEARAPSAHRRSEGGAAASTYGEAAAYGWSWR